MDLEEIYARWRRADLHGHTEEYVDRDGRPVLRWDALPDRQPGFKRDWRLYAPDAAEERERAHEAIGILMQAIETAYSDVDELREAVAEAIKTRRVHAALRAAHVQHEASANCAECYRPWPCSTARAVESVE